VLKLCEPKGDLVDELESVDIAHPSLRPLIDLYPLTDNLLDLIMHLLLYAHSIPPQYQHLLLLFLIKLPPHGN
jgi:hypothetical protein